MRPRTTPTVRNRTVKGHAAARKSRLWLVPKLPTHETAGIERAFKELWVIAPSHGPPRA